MSAPDGRPVVELGWVLAGKISAVDREAIGIARARTLDYVRDTLGDFAWDMPLVVRKEAIAARPVAPLTLLDLGVTEQDAAHWDFALVVTEMDLLGFSKPGAWGAPAASLNTAALSTARIDPVATRDDIDERARVESLAQRIFALALHLLGHLAQLGHDEDRRSAMTEFRVVEDLDHVDGYASEELEEMREHMRGVADLRLEERAGARNATWFYLRALSLNALDIVGAVFRMKPWEFPVRLARLTTPAVSALVILLMTAEAWDLGMSQPPQRVWIFSSAALFASTAYVLSQQRMLGRRVRNLTEVYVVSHASSLLGVFFGMATTFILLFGATLGVAYALFDPQLVANWAASHPSPIGLREHLSLAALVASVGLVIGALGTSFEAQNFVRHVSIVDEET